MYVRAGVYMFMIVSWSWVCIYISVDMYVYIGAETYLRGIECRWPDKSWPQLFKNSLSHLIVSPADVVCLYLFFMSSIWVAKNPEIGMFTPGYRLGSVCYCFFFLFVKGFRCEVSHKLPPLFKKHFYSSFLFSPWNRFSLMHFDSTRWERQHNMRSDDLCGRRYMTRFVFP